LQWPPLLTLTSNEESPTLYGQVYARGLTDTHRTAAAPGLRVEIGYGPYDDDPRSPQNLWLWSDQTSYHKNAGLGQNNQEYQATLRLAAPGLYRYTFRYAVEGGPWVYGERADALHKASIQGHTPEAFGSLAVIQKGATLRAASLNLHGLIDQPERRFAAIARGFRSEQVDLIALQEVCLSPEGFHSAQKIVEGLNSFPGPRYTALFVPTHTAGSPPNAIPEGIGLISRYPILDAIAFDLPPDQPPPKATFPRKALWSRILTPLGVLAFASTHLDYRPDNEAWRVRQVGALKTLLSSPDHPAFATLLGGDFNATPSSQTYLAMTHAQGDDEKGRPAILDLLAPFDAGPTFPSPHPVDRIDYLFFQAKEPAASRLKATQGKRLFAKPSEGLYLSDHVGILVELQVA